VIRQASDVPIGNRYGMSEGVFAGFCGHGIHLPEDLCLVRARRSGWQGTTMPSR
jgi:hypothetical protein